MSLLRLIARLDIKGPNVIKGVRFEGLKVVGKPKDLAIKYASQADELLYIDTVASLYGRNQLTSLLEETTNDVFIPVTVGGGVKSKGDVQRLLNAGADKVAVNTEAVRRPDLINEIADSYGNQCLVVSIQAKRSKSGWECYTDCGREKGGQEVERWAEEAVKRGAGEILITSVDNDGTCRGFDVDLISRLTSLPVPVVACGGMGNLGHLVEVIEKGKADAVAMATSIHYNCLTFQEMRDELASRKLLTKGGSETRGREEGPGRGVSEESEGINRWINGLRGAAKTLLGR